MEHQSNFPYPSLGYRGFLTYTVVVFWWVTILEPGPFRTTCVAENLVRHPVHPAYTDPLLRTMRCRAAFANPNLVITADPAKLAEAMYKANFGGPPLRLPIHATSVAMVRQRGEHLLKTADNWGLWSEDVLTND
ncbi:hypothetical protein V8E55_011647 [Tylopilus felleus]